MVSLQNTTHTKTSAALHRIPGHFVEMDSQKALDRTYKLIWLLNLIVVLMYAQLRKFYNSGLLGQCTGHNSRIAFEAPGKLLDAVECCESLFG